MDLEIAPQIGVGPIRFGMTVDQVRMVMKSPVTPFMKSDHSLFPTDAFDDFGIHVFYKQSGICEAVELYKPSAPSLFGHYIIGQPFDYIAKWVKELDSKAELESSGLTSYGRGISLYAPFAAKEPTAPIESVFVFAKDYYA